MYQSILIVGNVGRDPEMSYTPQGIAVCKFSVAVNKVTGKGDKRRERTTWFRVTVWREYAETAANMVRKGSRIMVIGEIDASAYIDKSGQAACTLELTCEKFRMLDKRPDGDKASAQAGEAVQAGETEEAPEF